MTIRKAELKDAKYIRGMTLKYNISRNSPAPTGFVEYPVPDLKTFEFWIQNSPYFYVAEDKDTIIGL